MNPKSTKCQFCGSKTSVGPSGRMHKHKRKSGEFCSAGYMVLCTEAIEERAAANPETTIRIKHARVRAVAQWLDENTEYIDAVGAVITAIKQAQKNKAQAAEVKA